MDPQKQIRDNTQELHDFIKDLQDWEKTVKDKDSRLKSQSKSQEKQIPPVRKLRPQGPSTEPQNAAKHTYDYFKDKWDKFDMDAALKEVDEKPSKSKASRDEQPMDATPMGAPQTFVSEACETSSDVLSDAVAEKDRGNECFKEKKYVQAIECYSRSIAFHPTAVSYANRAMALLKIRRYEDAEADCSEAISLDDRYVKAYARRGTARKERNKLLGAVEDFEFALRLEPNNKELENQYQEAKAMYEKKNPYRPAQNKVHLDVQKPSAQEDGSLAARKGIESTSAVLATVHEKSKRSHVEASPATSAVLATVHEKSIRPHVEEQKASPATFDGSISSEKADESRVQKEQAIQAAATRAAATAMSAVAQNMVAPKTSFEFETLWRGFGEDYGAKTRLIKLVDPPMFPKIFRDALGAALLLDILKTLELLVDEDASMVIQVMDSLTRVGRFSMTLMFLSSKEKSAARQVFDKLSSVDNVPAEKLEILRRTYKL